MLQVFSWSDLDTLKVKVILKKSLKNETIYYLIWKVITVRTIKVRNNYSGFSIDEKISIINLEKT